jgi:hypothetical protein
MKKKILKHWEIICGKKVFDVFTEEKPTIKEIKHKYCWETIPYMFPIK